jgi:hypothetical protein
MAIFCSKYLLSKVDLPALGGPITATTPERCSFGVACSIGDVFIFERFLGNN